MTNQDNYLARKAFQELDKSIKDICKNTLQKIENADLKLAMLNAFSAASGLCFKTLLQQNKNSSNNE